MQIIIPDGFGTFGVIMATLMGLVMFWYAVRAFGVVLRKRKEAQNDN